MKTVLGILVAVVVLGAAGYFGFLFLLEKETAGMKTNIQALKTRMEKIEVFVEKEEKMSKEGEIKADAGLPQVIKTVNILAGRISSLEESLKKESAKRDEEFSKQKIQVDESIKKQNELLEKITNDQQAKMKNLVTEILIGRIREQILKFKGEVSNKNIGLAKNDLDTMLKTIDQLKDQVGQPKAEPIADLREQVKKAQSDLDSNLPASANRIELVWYEVNKLLKK
jgi:hypothetical protein